ncbi:MAG: hypothetical protein WCB04_15675 [Mycobacteriales bacterium]
MLMIQEELARARMRELHDEARREAVVGRLASLLRWQRRADDASRRERAANAAL